MTDARPAEPYLDATLGAWLVTRHADVAAALRDPRLVSSIDEVPDAHAAVREANARALSPARLAELGAAMDASARGLAATLPVGEPVDLVRDLAAPWSHAL